MTAVLAAILPILTWMVLLLSLQTPTVTNSETEDKDIRTPPKESIYNVPTPRTPRPKPITDRQVVQRGNYTCIRTRGTLPRKTINWKRVAYDMGGKVVRGIGAIGTDNPLTRTVVSWWQAFKGSVVAVDWSSQKKRLRRAIDAENPSRNGKTSNSFWKWPIFWGRSNCSKSTNYVNSNQTKQGSTEKDTRLKNLTDICCSKDHKPGSRLAQFCSKVISWLCPWFGAKKNVSSSTTTTEMTTTPPQTHDSKHDTSHDIITAHEWYKTWHRQPVEKIKSKTKSTSPSDNWWKFWEPGATVTKHTKKSNDVVHHIHHNHHYYHHFHFNYTSDLPPNTYLNHYWKLNPNVSRHSESVWALIHRMDPHHLHELYGEPKKRSAEERKETRRRTTYVLTTRAGQIKQNDYFRLHPQHREMPSIREQLESQMAWLKQEKHLNHEQLMQKRAEALHWRQKEVNPSMWFNGHLTRRSHKSDESADNSDAAFQPPCNMLHNHPNSSGWKRFRYTVNPARFKWNSNGITIGPPDQT